MTSEVCLMNRRAVVLAADSAVTVSHWRDGEMVESYLKGANKIFQLSIQNPVGLMIYDSADILRVPWETIAKDFRVHIGNQAFNTLEEYANSFFEFMNSSQLYFPAHVQEDNLIDKAENAVLSFLSANVAKTDPPEAEEVRDARMGGEIQARINQLNADPFVAGLTSDQLNASIANFSEKLIATLEKTAEGVKVPPRDHPAALAELGFKEVFKHPERWFQCTGLVFAGFGNHEIFPQAIEYNSCGVFGSKHAAVKKDNYSIDHDRPAIITGFAQTSMIDTFITGLSEDVFRGFAANAFNGLLEFAGVISSACGGDIKKIENLAELVEHQHIKMRSSILKKARDEHGTPLRRVLGSLSIEEMCELAETLVNLQSLKEKVTKPSASVGGPTDVAAISRSEGLIWIKRKHYFDPTLNPRYLQRNTHTNK